MNPEQRRKRLPPRPGCGKCARRCAGRATWSLRRGQRTSTAPAVLWLAVSTRISEPSTRLRLDMPPMGLQQQLDVADGVGLQLAGGFARQGVDVQPLDDALHLGLDPAVAVQRPVHAAGHQRLVVQPGDGGGQLRAWWARRPRRRGCRSVGRGAVVAGLGAATIQSPREMSTSRSSTMPALCPAPTWCGRRAWSSTCATTACWPPGAPARYAGLSQFAGGHTAPEHAAALRGVGGRGKLLDPLHGGRPRAVRARPA